MFRFRFRFRFSFQNQLKPKTFFLAKFPKGKLKLKLKLSKLQFRFLISFPSRMNPKYVANLTPSQKLLQEQAIRRSQTYYERTGKVKPRPEVSDQPTKRSAHAAEFEDKYGYKVSDISRVKKDFPDTDVDTILRKGKGAYMSSGSRPNTTPEAWAKARLASVLTGGKALKVDKNLVGADSLKKIRS